AFFGRVGVHRDGTDRREPGLLQHRRSLALREVAAVRHDMRRQNTRGARLLAHLHDELVGRAMRVPARIFLVRNDDVAYETLDLGRDLRGPLCTDPDHGAPFFFAWLWSVIASPGRSGETRAPFRAVPDSKESKTPLNPLFVALPIRK